VRVNWNSDCFGAFRKLIDSIGSKCTDVSSTALLPLNIDLRYGSQVRENFILPAPLLSFAELPPAAYHYEVVIIWYCPRNFACKETLVHINPKSIVCVKWSSCYIVPVFMPLFFFCVCVHEFLCCKEDSVCSVYVSVNHSMMLGIQLQYHQCNVSYHVHMPLTISLSTYCWILS
jgi:hypothetical protein